MVTIDAQLDRTFAALADSTRRAILEYRIDPAIHESVLERNGCRTVVMGGRSYRGYVYVNEAGLATREDFDYWAGLALGYNAKAKPLARSRRR